MDPYQSIIVKTDLYAQKEEIHGNLVAVLDWAHDNRKLELIYPASRCLLKNEIHELILTDEKVKPGDIVNKVSYIGFFEVKEGGVILQGDEIFIGDQFIGEIVGYDETHMPNHMNIVIYSSIISTGQEKGLKLNEKVIIRKPKK